MMTSVWSLPMYSAACLAYFRSMASSRIPMAKVRIGRLALFRRDGADERGVQPAGEQEADLRVGDQPFFDARDQLFADVSADGFQIVIEQTRDPRLRCRSSR